MEACYNARMDKDEMKWERIRDVLIAEGTGKAAPRISSTRTLFGIPSAVDEAMDAIVAEAEAKHRAEREERRRRAQEAASQNDVEA